jgi:hypothetical protein
LGRHFREKESQKAVKRLLAMLLVSGLVVAVYVWKKPETFDSILGRSTQTEPPATWMTDDASGKPAQKSKSGRSASKKPASAAAPGAEPELVPVKIPVPKDAPPLVDISQAQVKADSAPVYSSNSPRSSIVRVLTKGEKVETNLEVIDSEGRWSLVRTGDLKRSGFVRSESLDRAQIAVRTN